VAEVLASEGCELVICSRTQADIEAVAEDLRSRLGASVTALSCDVSVEGSLRRFFDHSLSSLGGVDILVTNNGGPPPGGLESLTDGDWATAAALQLMSVVRSCRPVFPIMKRQGRGRIINVTSVSVKQPLPNMMLSNTLRAAVAGFSKSLALDIAPCGILVQCVMPGSFLTDRNRDLGARVMADRGISEEQLFREWTAQVPLGRMGDPLEFGQFVAFLASDRCSFTTGSCIPIEGGQIRSLT
jgi:3-oxoacyl-[acyl-carrier protein] reductase